MDLTKEFPRSPRATLMDIPMLPRTIDKARAVVSSSAGEYVFGEKSSFDMAMLDFLGLTPAAFLEGVRESPDDAAMLGWLDAHARKTTPAERAEFASVFLNDGDDDADRARFRERRAKLPAGVRGRVTGWVDLLDVDEGRIA
ncbi:MAG TPA: DUF5069 domain-containing protein [Candidatus Eremiobacteraceae bacterium]|nr:DUF5069 domain-containing protein [Candidatus Eremiobacteraceae bacterium]